jgi:hypothetical protein
VSRSADRERRWGSTSLDPLMMAMMIAAAVAPTRLIEAPTAVAVQRIHERAGHPADTVYEVSVDA